MKTEPPKGPVPEGPARPSARRSAARLCLISLNVAALVLLLSVAALGTFTSPRTATASVGTQTLGTSTLTCSSLIGLTVTLSWTAVTGAATYDIYRQHNSGGYAFLKTVAGLTTTDTPGLAVLQTFDYRLQARNHLWTGPNSNSVHVTTVSCG